MVSRSTATVDWIVCRLSALYILILEAYIVSSKTPAEVFGVECVAQGEDAPYQRIIEPEFGEHVSTLCASCFQCASYTAT